MNLFAFLFAQAVQVTSGPALDYQPDMILSQDGRILVVYEVLDTSDLSGDLFSVYSTDSGSRWSSPAPVIATPSWSERHPALVQMPDGTCYLYYLSDSTAVQYRIHLSVSTDFVNWTPMGPIDIGWGESAHQINPDVILEPDSSLSMSYQLLTLGYSNLGGYVAHSADGLVWDIQMRQVDAGARLPRMAKWRDSVYLVNYQKGSGSNYDIYYKTSTDLTSWSSETRLTFTNNSHDSHPVPMGDTGMAAFYSTALTSQYDIYYQTSGDLVNWGDIEQLTDNSVYDNQAHGLCVNDTLWVIWSQSVYATPYLDHDLYFLKLVPAALGEKSGAGTGPSLRITPNPCLGGSFIAFNPGQDCQARVAIYDPSGRLVRELFAGAVNGTELRIATGNLSPGFYIVVANAGEKRFTGNLVVE